ncbi:MAG: sulfatase [Flavobacteriales bacterium]|nr:sulfatase [Flavobacteriales bacterium]
MIKNILILALTLQFSVQINAQENKQQKRPNIILLTMDDLKPMLGAYGDNYIKTPNIDKLASESLVFDNAYVQQAVCAVSRVSVFSGERPDRTKVWDLKTDARTVNPDAYTMFQFFKDNGYETVGLGKLLHGFAHEDPIGWSIPYTEKDDMIYADGFEYPANGRYQSPKVQKEYKDAKSLKMGWQKTNKYLKSKGALPPTENLDIPDNAYVDGATADGGIKLLDKLTKSDKPFFLALGFSKPHLPFVAPTKYWNMYNREDIKVAPYQEHSEDSPSYAYHSWGELRAYSGIPQKGPVPYEQQKELIHGYHASVSYVDAQVGRVLDKIKELGIEDNTIIVLWGDHGWHLGDHGLWSKHSNFEQATKIPFIIYAPDAVKGVRTPTMVEAVDIYPTLVDYAGFDIPKKLEGKSLVPVLKDPKVEIKDYALSQFARGTNVMGYSIRADRYRLTLWLKGEFHKKASFVNPEIVGEELYDYEIDPLEKTSFAHDKSYAEVEKQLKDKLLSLLREQKKEYGY